MNRFSFICYCYLLCSLFNIVLAEQTAYRRIATPEGYQYTFAWLDHDKKPRKIQFVLPEESSRNLPVQQVNYNPDLALRAVEVELLKAARDIDPRVARFKLINRHDSLEFSLSGKDEEQLDVLTAQLKETQDSALDNYLSERYFQHYKTPLLQEAIKPNHVRYIEESTLPLIPLAQSLYDIVDEQSNARSYLNLLLSWAQTIPYDELTNRVSSNGSGFSPPLAVLNQNLGDCDSKSVLTAALIRAFLPGNSMRLVLLNNHALLAIAMTPLAKDATMMIDGMPFILLDPTGPIQTKLGEVSQSTKLAIASKQYTLEVIPPAVPARDKLGN